MKLPEVIKRHEKTLLVLTASLGLSVLLINFEFNLLEAGLYDMRVAHGAQLRPDPSVVLVTLDDATTKSLDEFSPLPLDYHARFMEALERLEPRAVGYLVDFARVNEANPELFGDRSKWPARFVDAANRMRKRGASVFLGTPFKVTGEEVPPYPLSTLPHALAQIHVDGNVFSEDKVTRRALLHLNGEPVLHLALAQALGSVRGPDDLPPGRFTVREADAEFFFFRYHGNTAIDSDAGRDSGYSRVPFADVLAGQLPEGYFRDKVVLVGTLSRESSSDYTLTPYSRHPFASPRLIVHADILDSILHREGVVRLPKPANAAVTFALTSVVVWWVLSTTPLFGLLLTGALILAFVGACQLLFQTWGVWLRESQPLMGIFFSYYLFVPYRLIREYKKRWDYQRKNELLTQVEELKTNFLSLVTHDLKTPVARIQGLTEVLGRQAQERLQAPDREMLRHIGQATEELNRFITSILELNKVESRRLHLNIESRDVNQLIERLLENFWAQARAKEIRINAQLEPLFPIRIDASLISKVVSNLIDNAIKYSSPGSQIWVESREIGEWVEISVRDQGIGLTAAESEQLFTRFYRAKNDATARTAGTGLGLYLTKYFIEAHRGVVEFRSEPGKGSQFRIRLPLRLPDDFKPTFEMDDAAPAVRPGLRGSFKRGLDKFGTSRGQSKAADPVAEAEERK